MFPPRAGCARLVTQRSGVLLGIASAARGYVISPLVAVAFGSRGNRAPDRGSTRRPSSRFLIGGLVAGAARPTSHWIGLSLVWPALVVLTWDGLRAAWDEPVRDEP